MNEKTISSTAGSQSEVRSNGPSAGEVQKLFAEQTDKLTEAKRQVRKIAGLKKVREKHLEAAISCREALHSASCKAGEAFAEFITAAITAS